ncbi:Putative SOS response-associated peptidase YedK [Sinosporangium album]|uniref:Abasic site processing protein n=1 Tax=Sinosporangium album TaxID=504805 RepID=A0A1G8HBF0_9ACTN|nr:SOS response-associated peptidase [Sinosporangium album]SDI03929.1 Putative SOS response-associated peptidase YedK [Sinosporangium album]
MCGRYASARGKHELLEEFQVELDGASDEELAPDYNVAPTKNVYAVLSRVPKGGERAVRQLRVLRWGLVPAWAKDPSSGAKMINARAETVAEKPAYRKAFAQRRCLIPADGFYEWYKSDKNPKKKQPYYIHPRDGGVMAMAGLYEFWKDPSRAADDPLRWLATCTIITTDAEDDIGHIHDRMPMLIETDRWAEWLDPMLTDPGAARRLLVPPTPGRLAARPVSTAVNDVRKNGPELVKEVDGDESALF